MSIARTYFRGVKAGIPIGLGYLSVSFSFGIMAVSMGLHLWQALAISMTTLTSAGQLSGIHTMMMPGQYVEMLISQMTINVRYSFMSIALSQKTDEKFKGIWRLLFGFSMTDEIFAVAASQKGKITARYFYGLMLLPILGWVAGTFLGATAGNILPDSLKNAMGLMLYAMFIAIVLPPSTKSRAVAICVSICAVLSIIIRYVPVFSFITPGFAVIICAVIASLFAAWRFPVEKEDA